MEFFLRIGNFSSQKKKRDKHLETYYKSLKKSLKNKKKVTLIFFRFFFTKKSDFKIMGKLEQKIYLCATMAFLQWNNTLLIYLKKALFYFIKLGKRNYKNKKSEI